VRTFTKPNGVNGLEAIALCRQWNREVNVGNLIGYKPHPLLPMEPRETLSAAFFRKDKAWVLLKGFNEGVELCHCTALGTEEFQPWVLLGLQSLEKENV
jgi:hypothetical protein